MGHMPVQQRAEETRALIINCAVETFTATGYDATGVAEICRSAGISKGAFYHHFPSKQALFLELLNDWMSNIDNKLRVIRDEHHSVPETLVAMIAVFRDIFASSRSRIPMFFEFLTKAARTQDIHKAALEPYQRYGRYFSQILSQGIEEGSVKKIDPDATANILVSLAVGLVLQGMLDPDKAHWERLRKKR